METNIPRSVIVPLVDDARQIDRTRTYRAVVTYPLVRPGFDVRGSIQLPDVAGIRALVAKLFPPVGTLPEVALAVPPPAAPAASGSGVSSCLPAPTPVPTARPTAVPSPATPAASPTASPGVTPRPRRRRPRSRPRRRRAPSHRPAPEPSPARWPRPARCPDRTGLLVRPIAAGIPKGSPGSHEARGGRPRRVYGRPRRAYAVIGRLITPPSTVHARASDTPAAPLPPGAGAPVALAVSSVASSPVHGSRAAALAATNGAGSCVGRASVGRRAGYRPVQHGRGQRAGRRASRSPRRRRHAGRGRSRRGGQGRARVAPNPAPSERRRRASRVPGRRPRARRRRNRLPTRAARAGAAVSWRWRTGWRPRRASDGRDVRPRPRSCPEPAKRSATRSPGSLEAAMRRARSASGFWVG